MSQAYGGIIWGIESALSEASEVDPRYGGFLNSNLAEYAMAVNADIRDLDVSFIDEPDERVNALGAKGVGEVVSRRRDRCDRQRDPSRYGQTCQTFPD